MGTIIRSFVKKIWVILSVVIIIFPQIAYAELPLELENVIPGEAQEILEDIDSDTNSLQKGLSLILEKAKELLPEIFRSGVHSAVLLLGVVMLCGLAQGFIADSDNISSKCVTAAGIMAVTLLTTHEMESVMGTASRIIEELDVFSKAFFPSLAAAVAAGGGVLSAGVRQTATIFFADILLGLIHDLLLPLTYYYIAATAMAALLPQQNLNGLASGMKKVITWFLTVFLLLFTGYLTISGSAATSADAMTMQLTKSAISSAVPVVGGIISDAAGSVLQSAGLLKNTLGIAGMLAVLATCLSPFLMMAVRYLLFQAAGFLSGVFGDNPVARYIAELGNAFGLVLGMTGSCVLLLLISITSCISVVVT